MKGDSGNKTAIIYRGLAWVFFPSSSLYRHHAQLIPVHFARPAQFSVTFYHGTTPGRCWLRPRHTGWRQAILTQEHVARCSPHSLVGAQKTAVTCLSIFSSSLPFSLNLSSVKHPNCARGNIKIHCRCAGSANSAPPSALFFNTLFTHAFFLIAKNDFLFGDSFPLWERNGVKQKQRDGV